MKRDVFLCHAGEDKRNVVIPLAEAMENQGVKCWVDEGEIKWGDSITQKVNEGLRISQYVIVVLSESFLGKHWPERELYAALNIEASTGKVKVLPLLVGDNLTYLCPRLTECLYSMSRHRIGHRVVQKVEEVGGGPLQLYQQRAFVQRPYP
jgi:hypothetical protein